jgi:hypothetical protein
VVFESSLTPPAAAAQSIACQIGYGPAGSNPIADAAWTWSNASFNIQTGSNEEYQAQLVAPAPGSYRYAARFTRDGVHWTYADANGAGSNPGLDFNPADLPVMAVTQ